MASSSITSDQVKIAQAVMGRKMGEWKTYNDEGYGVQLVAYKDGMLVGNFEMLTIVENQQREMIAEWCIVKGSYSHSQMPITDTTTFSSSNVVNAGRIKSNFMVKHRAVLRLEPHFFLLNPSGTYTVRINSYLEENGDTDVIPSDKFTTIVLYNVTREGLYSLSGRGSEIVLGGGVSLVGHEHGKAPPEAKRF